jgi:DNA-binding GntR family transcriptional regulator
LMIELLKGRDSWALAQLCVDHMQYSKSDYLGRIAQEEPAEEKHPDEKHPDEKSTE